MKRWLIKACASISLLSLITTTTFVDAATLKTNILNNKEINIYVEKPDDWRNIWIWYDSDLYTSVWDTTQLASAPGDMQEYRDGWYKKTVNSNEVQFLFNDGSWSKKLSNFGNVFKTDKDIWIKKDGETSYSDPKQQEPVTENSVKVHYYSTNGQANIYYWNLVPSYKPCSWPGNEMIEEGNGWYYYELKNTDSTNLLFNNCGGNKTLDLSRTSGEWWYYEGQWYDHNPITPPNPDDPVVKESVHLYYYSENDIPNVYYWNTVPAGKKNSWPGDKMTPYSGKDNWYEFNINNAQSTNLIFNFNGSNQTADLKQVSGDWCYKDGQWIEGKPDNFTQNSVKLHFKSETGVPSIHYENTLPADKSNKAEGEVMTSEGNDWYYYEVKSADKADLVFYVNGEKVAETTQSYGEWWCKNNSWTKSCPESNHNIIVHCKSDVGVPNLSYKDTVPEDKSDNDIRMNKDNNDWYSYTIKNVDSAKIRLSINNRFTNEVTRNYGEWWYKDGEWTAFNPEIENKRTDFRDESIYFVMTSRFYDGDKSNNVHCWDDKQAKNPDSDPAWRGDFKGLIEKLDYIKALGFSAIWITPVVENASGYDYHGYHAINLSEVDPRYESIDTSYQDLINAAHSKGIKVIQDIVLNHTGNFGEENLFPLFQKSSSNLDTIDCLKKKDPNNLLGSDYDTLQPNNQYTARINAMKEDSKDFNKIYHHEKSLSWEGYTVQTGQIAGDCVDLNTENKEVTDYLINAYNKYIDMGVDGFRVDTVKHISRLTFNNEFIPAFKQRGGDNFYIFGEVCSRYRQVWNNGNPAISSPFYTWKENKTYPWTTTEERENSVLQNWSDNQNPSSQPTSNNHKLDGNEYHKPDYSKRSGLDVIDFPMHWNFNNAHDAFGVALDGDKWYNDATWNVTYVDSHDYAPDGAPENVRFNGSQDTWAENLDLMFTFRGIPTIYYGSEIEFMKGAPIDVGPNKPLSETGRAYFGDKIEGSVNVSDYGVYSSATGAMADTLSYPLAKHIQKLNRIRRAIPALRKGEYSTDGVNGSMAFKRRYTEGGIDSFVAVSISGGATFTGIPNGRYVDAVTGDVKNVTNGTLNISSLGKGNMRVYVLDLGGINAAPGKIGECGTYLN